MWRSIFDSTTGRLLSVGSVWTIPPRPGTDFLETFERPDQGGNMWDEATRDWVPRPQKVLIDRMDDLESHPSFKPFQDVFNALSGGEKGKMRSSIIKLLGADRFRSSTQSVEIGR